LFFLHHPWPPSPQVDHAPLTQARSGLRVIRSELAQLPLQTPALTITGYIPLPVVRWRRSFLVSNPAARPAAFRDLLLGLAGLPPLPPCVLGLPAGQPIDRAALLLLTGSSRVLDC
jgi:hypothetical protein